MKTHTPTTAERMRSVAEGIRDLRERGSMTFEDEVRLLTEAASRCVEIELEMCAAAARIVADEYDQARERFSGRPDTSVARKYSDMRDGALAVEREINARQLLPRRLLRGASTLVRRR